MPGLALDPCLMSATYRAVAEAPHDGVGVSFAGLQDAVGEVGGVDGVGEILQSRR